MKTEYNLFINTIDKAQPSFVFRNNKGKSLYSYKFIDRQEDLVGRLKYFLLKHRLGLDRLSGIFVLKGEGSFTAVRAGVVLANAIAFLGGIPAQMIDSSDIAKKYARPKKRSFAAAYYNKEPNITL